MSAQEITYSTPIPISLNGGSAALVLYALLVLDLVRRLGIIGRWLA